MLYRLRRAYGEDRRGYVLVLVIVAAVLAAVVWLALLTPAVHHVLRR
jgi:hypothetical protein